MSERILRDVLVFRADDDDRPFMDAAFPWLETGDSLLRAPVGNEDAFHPLRDWAGNVFAQLQFYALQYRNAARDLVERWLHGRGPAESSVFAIAFMYRQAIELYLKSYIVEYTRGFAQLPTKDQWDLTKGHDLNLLWERARAVIPTGTFDDAPDHLDNITRVLGELASIDERADGFRYPFRISGNSKNLTIEELAVPLERMSADNFLWGLEALTNCIAIIPDAIERHRQFLREVAAEAEY